MAELSKTRTLMHRLGGTAFGCEEDDGDKREHCVIVDQDVWSDMGCPETITVTIEPGDKLNGDPE